MIDSLDHHAYGVAGKSSEILPQLIASLEKTGLSTKGNPDVRIEQYETMGIDEARALSEAAQRTAVTGGLPTAQGWAQAGKKVFVVAAAGLTREAQNALLKIFEEPPKDTYFFLIVPSFELLLSTLRSRLCEILYLTDRGGKASARAVEFLKATMPIRLKTIQAMLKKAEEDEAKTDLVLLLDELEWAAVSTHGYAELIRTDRRYADAVFELLDTKRYARDRAPSFKLLLEHLALVLPVVK